MNSQDFGPQLEKARSLLAELNEHIRSFPIERLFYQAPILDRIRFEGWGQDEVMGLKKWMDGVGYHARLLDSMSESSIPPKEDPLPSVYGLITFWKIIITSPPPIVGIRMPMGGEKHLNIPTKGVIDYRNRSPARAEAGVGQSGSGAKGKKSWPKAKADPKVKEVWVDVVADGGRVWKRIYSKKVSHLLAEFREADSYINSDFDSDSETDTPSGSELGNGNGNGSGSGGLRGSQAAQEPANSLLTTAQDLQRAAGCVPRIPGAEIPRLIIHLTRIPSSAAELYAEYGIAPESVDEIGNAEWPDSRIHETFAKIRSMAIELSFGDLSSFPLSCLNGCPTPSTPIPSLRLNLDITTLMGLCSDVLHHPLPKSKAEAASRSLRPKTHLLTNSSSSSGSRGRDGTGKGKGKGKKEDEELEDNEEELRGQSQNSRELYRCLLEEMERPFIEEFEKIVRDAWRDQKQRHLGQRSGVKPDEVDDLPNVGRLDIDSDTACSAVSGYANDDFPLDQVEFWTTPQAAQYTYEALSSGPAHGHGGEQRRMRKMLGLEAGDFFEGSRYGGKEGVFKGFKVRVFDVEKFVPGPSDSTESDRSCSSPSLSPFQSEDGSAPVRGKGHEIDKTGFHRTLASITRFFLQQYYTSRSSSPSSSTELKLTAFRGEALPVSLPNFLQPKKLPTPPIAKISLPFPVVSLHSLHRGAEEGMTTLMMGTATLKEVWGQVGWRVRGWERGWYDWEVPLDPLSVKHAEHAEHEAPNHFNTEDTVGTTDSSLENSRLESEQEGKRRRENGHATVMIFPYRVFGEGKRVRFERGDYSYPTPDNKG